MMAMKKNSIYNGNEFTVFIKTMKKVLIMAMKK